MTASLSVISDEDKEIRENIEADIEYIDLEGGFYAIKSDQGNFLPVNIQEDLKANVGDTLEIKSAYSEKDTMSIFMWGTLIFVTDYEIKKKNNTTSYY